MSTMRVKGYEDIADVLIDIKCDIEVAFHNQRQEHPDKLDRFLHQIQLRRIYFYAVNAAW